MSDVGISEICHVYLFGYPHERFGHVVKVGISSNVFSRLAFQEWDELHGVVA